MQIFLGSTKIAVKGDVQHNKLCGKPPQYRIGRQLFIFYPRDATRKRVTCYGNVAGWLAGCLAGWISHAGIVSILLHSYSFIVQVDITQLQTDKETRKEERIIYICSC